MATMMEKVQDQFDTLVAKAKENEKIAEFIEKIEAALAEGGSLYEYRKKIEELVAKFSKSDDKALQDKEEAPEDAADEE